MADASSPNLWVTLLTLGVGGGLTLLGGWLGPYLLEGRKEAADKKKRRTEKFEELVAAVYEFDHWLDRCRSITAFGEEGKVEVSPFAKIQAISSIYFPQLGNKITELDHTATVIQAWVTEAGYKRLSGKLQTIEGFEGVINPYLIKRDALVTALKEFARSEFQ